VSARHEHAFVPFLSRFHSHETNSTLDRSFSTIAEGVDFDTVAREWRCRWSVEDDKASLVAAQKAFEKSLEQLKQVDGIIKVDRIVCGGCKDFKVRI
jgi:hypothetical protein